MSGREHQTGGMLSRGVTRPMAQQQAAESQRSSDGGHAAGDSHDSDERARLRMLRMHHELTLWVYRLLIMLGVWLVLHPLTFSYSQATVDRSGGREICSTWTNAPRR